MEFYMKLYIKLHVHVIIIIIIIIIIINIMTVDILSVYIVHILPVGLQPYIDDHSCDYL